MKFFIGIVPPIATKERIFNFQKSFPSNKVPYFNEPHITLKAPSSLSEDKSWLAQVIALTGNHLPFQVSFDGIDEFEDRVLFLKLNPSNGLIDLHNKLIALLNPDGESREKFFEGLLYHPHLTLGETTWGGMNSEDLMAMKEKAKFEFRSVPPFLVTSVRLYQKEGDGDLYKKFLDIPLKI